jgi:hypothetical protein
MNYMESLAVVLAAIYIYRERERERCIYRGDMIITLTSN